MNSKYVWKYRQSMMERATRLILANWRNKQINGQYVESCHLDIWFTRNIGRYGYWSQGIHVKSSDMVKLQNKFWFDVITILENEYGVG